MKKHVESIHEEKNKHRCNICTKGFAEKAKMIGHIASFHERKKSHLCATCDASFDYSGTILGSSQGKKKGNTEINKQSHVKFWLNRKNMELPPIY